MSSRHADSLPNRYETPAFSRNLVTYPQPVDDTRRAVGRVARKPTRRTVTKCLHEDDEHQEREQRAEGEGRDGIHFDSYCWYVIIIARGSDTTACSR